MAMKVFVWDESSKLRDEAIGTDLLLKRHVQDRSIDEYELVKPGGVPRECFIVRLRGNAAECSCGSAGLCVHMWVCRLYREGVLDLSTTDDAGDEKEVSRAVEGKREVEYCEPKSEGEKLPVVSSGIVRPAVSAEEFKAAWDEYRKLRNSILESEDIQKIGDNQYVKKSGWRKIATAFNLSDEIIEERREDKGDGNFLWRIKVKVTAPNGRYAVGIGVCDTTERRRGGDSFAHPEHDVYATAHTRAKNRAISDLVGGGEVSAEEIQ